MTDIQTSRYCRKQQKLTILHTALKIRSDFPHVLLLCSELSTRLRQEYIAVIQTLNTRVSPYH
jgi:hypothetical protein